MLGNVSIGVKDDRLAVVQCIERGYRINYVSIIVGPSGGRLSTQRFLYRSWVDIGDAVELPFAEPVVFSSLRDSLPPSEYLDLRISQLDQDQDLYVVLDGPDKPIEMSFLKISPKSLKEGVYVHHDRSISGDPCG